MKPTLKNAFSLRLREEKDYRHWVLLHLNERQTVDERKDKTTRWWNSVGFSTADAPVLTALAEKILSRQKLSAKDERTLLKRLPKYHAQFTEMKFTEPPAPRKGPGSATSGDSDSEGRVA
jgi:hypothetical protein